VPITALTPILGIEIVGVMARRAPAVAAEARASPSTTISVRPTLRMAIYLVNGAGRGAVASAISAAGGPEVACC